MKIFKLCEFLAKFDHLYKNSPLTYDDDDSATHRRRPCPASSTFFLSYFTSTQRFLQRNFSNAKSLILDKKSSKQPKLDSEIQQKSTKFRENQDNFKVENQNKIHFLTTDLLNSRQKS